MKSNYQPWNVSLDDFYKAETKAEKVQFLIRFAILAPSSHNSQPWAFKSDASSITIYAEKTRMLPIGDTNNRQLFISLGCAIENIVIAADYYGYDSVITHSENNDEVVRINLTDKQPSNDPGHLIFSIPKRKVNRGKYNDEKIGKNLLEMVKNLSTSKMIITVVEDTTMKIKLADVALAATSESMQNNKFREELSHFVISNTSSSRVGMPGFGLGFPTLISYFASRILKKFNMSKLSNKQDGPLLKKNTPYIVIISTKGDSRENWIDTGRSFEKTALITTQSNVSLAVWAAPIQIGEHYKEVQAILSTTFRPQMFFRMGYAVEDMGGHSPRLSLEDVVKH